MDHRSYDGYGSCRCDCTNIFFNSFNTGVRPVKVGRSDPLEHFAELLDNGKKYPTDADLTAWGIKDEVEFIRSHVRKRAIESRADRLLQDTYENRNLFMNIPGGAGKNLGGYPSKTFANDNFSMWNYTNLFGAWNYGLFQAPGSWLMLLTAMVQASSLVLSSSIIQRVELLTVGQALS